MTENDGNKFRELITMINVNYGEDFTEPQVLLWWNMFKPYSIGSFEQAIYLHIGCPDSGMFAPKPANIMKFITGTTKQNEQAIEDKAELAWHVIDGEIRRIGSYGSLKMKDKQAIAAVQAIGGWKHLCSLTNDKITWAHKEFISAYKNYERADLSALPDKLPGRIAIELHKAEKQQGLKTIAEGVKYYQKNLAENNKDKK